jgi:DNA-binding MarR family transcriptional regulator
MTPAEEVRYLILALQREGDRRFAESLRPLGITPAQAEVLRVLKAHAPVSLIGLGELLICETGSPSRLVQGLVEAGLIERTPSPSDKRMVTLRLTAAGENVAAQVADAEAHLHETIAGALPEGQLAALLSPLRALAAGTVGGGALERRAGRAEEGQ